jgi:thiol-disulfide isomerase/thioredoxin
MTPGVKKALKWIAFGSSILMILLVVAVIVILANGIATPSQEEVKEFKSISTPAFSLQRKSGKEVLAYVQQRKAPTLITCWASWCIPCRYDMKVLHAIESKYKAQHLEWILVNADRVSSNQEKYAKKVLVNMHITEKNWAVA